jgi:hypothetical protein
MIIFGNRHFAILFMMKSDLRMSILSLSFLENGAGMSKAGFDGRKNSWQRKIMPTDVAKPKVTPMQVMHDLARLTARQLETVIEHASALRLQ